MLFLDTKRFQDCFDQKLDRKKIEADIETAKQLNIKGTPLIIIQDQIYQGDVSAPKLRQILSTYLTK